MQRLQIGDIVEFEQEFCFYSIEKFGLIIDVVDFVDQYHIFPLDELVWYVVLFGTQQLVLSRKMIKPIIST